MSANKRLTDLIDYTSILPYDSEIFGVYQPLLGWKSKRIEKRFEDGFSNDKKSLLNVLKEKFSGQIKVKYGEGCQFEIQDIQPGSLVTGNLRSLDSVVLTSIAQKLPGFPEYKQSVWNDLLREDALDKVFKEEVVPYYTEIYFEACKGGFASPQIPRLARSRENSQSMKGSFINAFEKQLQYESAIAGGLQFLAKAKRYDDLRDVFYHVTDNEELVQGIIKALNAPGPQEAYLNLENMDPRDRSHIQSVALSPISVVHLFRQYFFELDSFLGTPVGHVWLSPGSSAELIEVSTRKTTVEKSLETSMETTTKSETDTTNQDEISEAVKEDNKQDIKFGASVSASYSSITANSSFDYNNSQQQSREETHKRMRQQTEKLSSEIRKNFKSTFKTVTEVTDTSSKRYVLTNTGNDLINYEMRRKMRQVGVQVQDIGTYLCWQTYVDDPGKDLGIAKLIHIAKTPDLEGIPHPEEIPMFQDFAEQNRIISIPFISVDDTDADNEGEVYVNGGEVDDSEFLGSYEKIQYKFDFDFVCPRANYELKNVEFDAQGKPVKISMDGPAENSAGKSTIHINLDSVDFQGKNSIDVSLTLYWTPVAGANDDIIQKNKENLEKFTAKEKELFEKTYIENAKERVKLASNIKPRNSEDLREEERIVVYRSLIQDMLSNGISMPDDKTRHVVAELINSIFDVDKMLYFVAPEWWRPRLHHSHQQLEENKPPLSKFDSLAVKTMKMVAQNAIAKKYYQDKMTVGDAMSLNSSAVGWGAVNENNRDNYFITEDSEPAKLGSSLGWLLQLDGDNMRNAFLNAPWVKAVIPIRPAKEEAAINWLKGVEGFNGIGDGDIYHASDPGEKDINGNLLEGQKLIDVLIDLARKIKKKHQDGLINGKYPKQDEVANPELVDAENVVTSTPIDRVYEHGFYALKDGFRANVGGNYEIFDQWIEVLPTDQVVPVEVKYNPKTGRQL
jgi:hypothetical protein